MCKEDPLQGLCFVNLARWRPTILEGKIISGTRVPLLLLNKCILSWGLKDNFEKEKFCDWYRYVLFHLLEVPRNPVLVPMSTGTTWMMCTCFEINEIFNFSGWAPVLGWKFNQNYSGKAPLWPSCSLPALGQTNPTAIFLDSNFVWTLTLTQRQSAEGSHFILLVYLGEREAINISGLIEKQWEARAGAWQLLLLQRERKSVVIAEQARALSRSPKSPWSPCCTEKEWQLFLQSKHELWAATGQRAAAGDEAPQ